nr:short-chain dehydrogenase/reductase trope [Quercus suber]
METKIVLITGANTGLGYETVKALLQSDTSYHILLSGRDLSKAQQASLAVVGEVPDSKSTVEAIQIDVESDESISVAFETVSRKHEKIDILINNAGASFDPHALDGRMSTREAWNRTWNVNVTSAHIVTETFLPHLLRSSNDPRLLFITSGASSIHDSADASSPLSKVPPAGLPKPPSPMAYRSSKTGLNMLMTAWSRMLKNDMVKVFAVAPGLLATSLGGDPETLKQRGAASPAVGGSSVRKVIEGEFDEYAGKVVRNYDSPVQPW